MVEGARRRVPTAVVLEADAQTTDLLTAAPGRPFDRVVSRFGVMFFDEPVTAFARVRAACAPGARLAFACWRTYEENPTFSVGQDVLVARMDEPPAPAAEPYAPGPMAFADPGHVRAVLEEAAWQDVAVAPARRDPRLRLRRQRRRREPPGRSSSPPRPASAPRPGCARASARSGGPSLLDAVRERLRESRVRRRACGCRARSGS